MEAVSLQKQSFPNFNYSVNWKQEPETDMSIPGGAGLTVSTPTDLTKFVEVLFALKLILNNSLVRMKTINDGLEWVVSTFHSTRKKPMDTAVL